MLLSFFLCEAQHTELTQKYLYEKLFWKDVMIYDSTASIRDTNTSIPYQTSSLTLFPNSYPKSIVKFDTLHTVIEDVIGTVIENSVKNYSRNYKDVNDTIKATSTIHSDGNGKDTLLELLTTEQGAYRHYKMRLHYSGSKLDSIINSVDGTGSGYFSPYISYQFFYSTTGSLDSILIRDLPNRARRSKLVNHYISNKLVSSEMINLYVNVTNTAYRFRYNSNGQIDQVKQYLLDVNTSKLLHSLTWTYIWKGFPTNVDQFAKQHDDAVLYPNPAKDLLYLKASQKYQSYAIRDISGKLVTANSIRSSEISLVGLSPGIYCIQLFGSDGNSIHKFIKQ